MSGPAVYVKDHSTGQMVGFESAGDAQKYVETSQGGASIASAESTNATNRALAEQQAYAENPSRYEWEAYQAHAKAVEEADKRADSGIGALLSLAGTSGMFGPLGQLGAAGAVAKVGTNQALGQPGRLNIGTPGQGALGSQIGILNTLTLGQGTRAIAGASEGARSYLESQQGSEGYQLGHNIGSAAGAMTLGGIGAAYLPGYAAATSGALGMMAEGGVTGAIAGAGDTIGTAAIKNTELTAEQILAGAGEGAIMGMVPGALYGASKAVGSGLRAIGKLSESKLAASPNEAAFNEALLRRGINPEEFAAKLDTPLTGFRTKADIEFAAKKIDDSYSKVANEYSRAVRSREAAASGATADVAAVRNNWETAFNNNEAMFMRGETDMLIPPEVKHGIDTILNKAQQMEGGLTQANFEKLSKMAEKLPAEYRQGADYGLDMLKSSLSDSMKSSVPGELGQKIGSLSERMQDLKLAKNLLKDMKPAGVVRAEGGPTQASNWEIASLVYGVAKGNLPSIAYGAIKAATRLSGASAIASRLVPTAIAGERFAQAVQGAAARTRGAGAGLVGAFNSGETPDRKPIVRNLDRGNLVDAVEGFRKIVEAGPDTSLMNKLGPGFSDTMSAKVSAIAMNVTRKADQLGVGSTKTSMSAYESPYGAAGSIMESRQMAKTKERIKSHGATASEMILWEYTKTAMDPGKALADVKTLSFTNTQLESLRDNYPKLLESVIDELMAQVSKQASVGKVPSLETRARMSKLIGKPVDTTTDPGFSSRVSVALAPPDPEGGQEYTGATGRSGNPRISETSMTESERLESK